MKSLVLLSTVVVLSVITSTQGHGRRYWRYREAYKDDVDNSSSASSEKYRPPPTVAATTEAPPQVAESSIDIRVTEDEPPKYETNVIIPAGPGPVVAKRQQEPTTNPPTNPTPRPIQPRPTRPPYDLQRVNDGVSTILGGVGSFRLSEILRGSFMFTRNDRVRNVANSVIDSIFGPRPENLPAKAGQGFLAGL